VHHPLQVAARVATLDIFSNGRVDVGVGRTKGPYQLTPFGTDVSQTQSMMLETLECLPGMWTQEVFSHEGENWSIPPREVIPKPVQKPHPPISLVGWSLDHAKRAGSAGLGFLDVAGGVDDALEMHRDAYVEARSNAEPDDLVCVSIYAAVLGDERASEMSSRLESWSSLEFDQAVLRVESKVEDAQRTRGKIRLMAGEFSDIH